MSRKSYRISKVFRLLQLSFERDIAHLHCYAEQNLLLSNDLVPFNAWWLQKVRRTLTNLQLKVAGLFKYVWPLLPPGIKGLTMVNKLLAGKV